MTLAEAEALDAADPLAPLRDRFMRPDGLIYLDGNSLGMLPQASVAASADMVERQWGERLIRSWNEGWIDAPTRIGGKIAPLIGADAGEVIAADSTSVNLFKLLVAALRRDPARTVVVSEAGNFPTDLHIAAGAVGCVPGAELRVVARDDLADALGDDTAVLLLTHVHYKTGARFDMARWTANAHAVGALVLWDLSHSAGAVAIDLNGANADLAVGCGYKYLNGGPGAPAYLFVAERWQAALGNPLSGWMGHAAPFAFTDDYVAATGMKRWLTGTPPVLGLGALEAALGLWDGVDFAMVERKSATLFDMLLAAGKAAGLECVTPRDPVARGSHISFRHDDAYAITQALIARGVIGDFRDPDVLRLGLTPLTLSHVDVWHAGRLLGEVIASGEWQRPEFTVRAAVT
ncbi:kynureninase [Sphingopyxis solisilvae]|uniref:kynureninase n=1 Tax=Sphingopyxis solisilvae TaxID=1886788 RepID=UPI001892AE53|nr:kynureninase [Sphingopyxis solisilvae]